MNESEYKTFITFVFPSQTSSSQNSNLLPLFSLTLHAAHHLVPLNYKPQLDDEMYECLNYFMFVEVLILISLSRGERTNYWFCCNSELGGERAIPRNEHLRIIFLNVGSRLFENASEY